MRPIAGFAHSAGVRRKIGVARAPGRQSRQPPTKTHSNLGIQACPKQKHPKPAATHPRKERTRDSGKSNATKKAEENLKKQVKPGGHGKLAKPAEVRQWALARKSKRGIKAFLIVSLARSFKN